MMAVMIFLLSALLSMVNLGFALETIKKFTSLRVVEFLVYPLTFLSTVLPFRSKIYMSLLGLLSCKVFSMIKKCTDPVYFVFTVNTPNTLDIKLSGLFLKCSAYFRTTGKKVYSSYLVSVFTINLLSWLKKKKLPLLPAPSPDLNI